MPASEQIELLLVVYPDPERAAPVLKDLLARRQSKQVQFRDAAAFRREADGHTTVSEPLDVSASQGSLFGAVVGGLIGLLGGPAGAVVGAMAGAAAGGLAARAADWGFDEKFLAQVKEALQPGSSALLILADAPWNDRLAAELRQPQARLLRNVLRADVIRRLQDKP